MQSSRECAAEDSRMGPQQERWTDKVQRTQDKVQQEWGGLLPASFVLQREVARVFLSQRCRRPEVMDQPGLSPDRHAQALGGLARINFWSGSAGILWPPLRDLSRRVGGRLRVLDLASGGGDVPIRLWYRARRAGLDWDVQGCDISPVAVAHAQKAAQRAGASVRFFVYDALNGPPQEPQDAVISSLFLH